MYTAKEFLVCDHLQTAYQLIQANKNNAIVAGNTWLHMTNRSLQTVIDLSSLNLNSITETEDEIEIGAMVTLRQIETNPILQNFAQGVLSNAVKPIVGVQFRNMATIGANVFSRHGFSDIIPVLLALQAEVSLVGTGRITLSEFLSSRILRDVLTHIYLPKNNISAIYLTQRKSATDFAMLNTCISFSSAGWLVCVGARPGAAKFAMRTMKYLNTTANASAKQAAQLASEELFFESNMRATSTYRRILCNVLVETAVSQLKEGIGECK